MAKILNEDIQFERNKKEILRRMKIENPNLPIIDNLNCTKNDCLEENTNGKYAWEYELEEYRKKKNLERFYKIGALAGIISLIITIVDKFIPIKELTYTTINCILK